MPVASSGESGLLEMIANSSSLLGTITNNIEKQEVDQFLSEIAKDGLVCFGHKHTLLALEYGAVKKVLVWNQLRRILLSSGDIILSNGEEINEEIIEDDLLIDWIKEKYLGIEIIEISERTPEGDNFCYGYRIGRFLRFNISLDVDP